MNYTEFNPLCIVAAVMETKQIIFRADYGGTFTCFRYSADQRIQHTGADVVLTLCTELI